MKKAITYGEGLWIVLALVILVIAVFALKNFVRYPNYPNQILSSKELEKDVGFQFCTSSVNTVDILCKDKNVIIPTYNKTQEEIDAVLEDCPDWVMLKGTHCIGELIEVRGK